MNVSSTGTSDATQSLLQTGAVDKRAQLQLLMLRKTLDSQQQQADELTNELEGKGQVIDLRV
jgi:hypothetical protein